MTYDEMVKRLGNPGGHTFLGELFQTISDCKRNEQRVDLLKRYAAKSNGHKNALVVFAQALWHEKAIFDLPYGTPPYKDNEYVDYTFAPSSLQKELLKVGYYIKGSSTFLSNSIRREKLFIQALETMHADEAKLLIMIKDRKITGYKGLTPENFLAAFPEITWLPVKKEDVGNESTDA